MVNASLNINWSDHFGHCIAKLRRHESHGLAPARVHQKAGAEFHDSIIIITKSEKQSK